jgi:hypothetical protein
MIANVMLRSVTFILADVSRDFDVLVVIHPVTLFGD